MMPPNIYKHYLESMKGVADDYFKNPPIWQYDSEPDSAVYNLAHEEAREINNKSLQGLYNNKSMTKKELQFQIDAAFAKLDEITKKVIHFHSRLDKVDNLIAKNTLDINERLDHIVKTQSNRYSMLLDYLKVQEEEYAELQKETTSIFGRTFTTKSEAVKKTRLAKVK